jgi:MHS family proline/betaine transporter-like MFS transporter
MLSLIGLYVRKYTTETPEFNDIKKTTEKAPLLKGLKEHPEIFVLTIMISSFAGVVIFLHEVFFPFFLKQLPFMTENFARLCGTISCWCFVILMPVFGLYSDLTYRLKPMRIGAILIIISMGSMFAYAHLLNRYSVLLLQITVGCSIAMFFSPLETFIAELFNKKIRCSCFAFCQNIGIGIFGGATPMIATLIASKTDGHLILACVVSCWGVLALVAMQQLQKGIIGK